MTPLNFVVTSTAKNAAEWAPKCIESVRNQTYPHWTHVYFAADYETRRAAERAAGPGTMVLYSPEPIFANLWPIWNTLEDDDIIVWIDGDDWLAHTSVLEHLASIYQREDRWLTYGNFIFYPPHPALGVFGFGGPYARNHVPRDMPLDWRATHLKTFRAGLVKRINESDLKKPNGAWCDYCTDRVVMLPLLEMAGSGRARGIDAPLCVYNYGASFSASAAPDKLAEEESERARIHAMPKYQPLERKPWL